MNNSMKQTVVGKRTLLWMFSLVLSVSVTTIQASEMNKPAPDFTLKSRSGKNVRLSDLRGQVVMLNFWASWCGPCRQEMPLLEEMSKKYERLGFTLLGVNVDEDSSKAEKLLEKIPVSFPVLYDNTSSVSELLNVDAMPTTYLIDRDGNLRFHHKGYKPGYEKSYEKQIKQLVRER